MTRHLSVLLQIGLFIVVGASLQGCGDAPADPLAEDVVRLSGPILHTLRPVDEIESRRAQGLDVSDITAEMRARVLAIEAVEQPDLWVAECGVEAASVYHELAASIEQGDADAVVVSRVLLGGTVPDQQDPDAPPQDDLVQGKWGLSRGSFSKIRAMEATRNSFLAGVERVEPDHETSVGFEVSYAESERGSVITLINTSGGSLDGVVAKIRLIAGDGSTAKTAAHALSWPSGESRSLLLYPFHGVPSIDKGGAVELIEVRLLSPALKSRPVRAQRPSDGWPSTGP